MDVECCGGQRAKQAKGGVLLGEKGKTDTDTAQHTKQLQCSWLAGWIGDSTLAYARPSCVDEGNGGMGVRVEAI
jgi:hypothetical protein